jgi:hypothetical protein
MKNQPDTMAKAPEPFTLTNPSSYVPAALATVLDVHEEFPQDEEAPLETEAL